MPSKHAMGESAIELDRIFRKEFGTHPVHRVRAPGRIEILGNHTDYNEGLVLSAAIDLALEAVSAPRMDGRIALATLHGDRRESFYLDQIQKNPEEPWADYIKGTLLALRRRGVRFTGFSMALGGNLPVGSGVSSSAAVEMATALTLRKLFPFRITRSGHVEAIGPKKRTSEELSALTRDEILHIARAGREAENDFVGARVGIMDQLTSLAGNTERLVSIDCRSETYTQVPWPADFAWVLCPSGSTHALVTNEYNSRRAACERAAAKLGVKALRDVTVADLHKNHKSLDQEEYSCARHVVEEIARVVHGERALHLGDIEQFGQYLWDSHESSKNNFHNSSPLQDLLVDISRNIPGCLGARLTGGGFGGSTLHLVDRRQIEAFVQKISSEFARLSGKEMHPVTVLVSSGAV